jgi:PAS domain S-box-containing protein
MPLTQPTAVQPGDVLRHQSGLWSAVGLGMLVLVGLISLWTLREVNLSDERVEHTREVISSADHLMSDLKDAENGQQAYLLTGSDSYLAPYTHVVSDISKPLANFRQLTADNPAQQRRLAELEPLVNREVASMAQSIQARRESGLDAARKAVLQGDARDTMRRIGELGTAMQAEEYRLLRQRSSLRQHRLAQGMSAALVATAIAILALVFAPLNVRRAVRQRDEALHKHLESRSLAQAFFEAASEAILMVDQGGRIVLTNPSAEKMFGYARAELVGQPVEMLVPERLRARHVGERDGYFHHPQTRPMGLGMDLQARRRDGTEFFSEISLSHIRTDHGTFAVVFVTDISKRRAYEIAVRKQQDELRLLAGRLMTAQDDERRRIARDLHDDLTQRLAYLAIDLGKLASKTAPDEVMGQLRPLQKRAADAAEAVRQVSHELHPSILDDIGIEAALEQYCQEFEERTGIATRFSSRNVPQPLKPEIASSVYHIAQECLRNVSKHAQARQASVTLESVDSHLRLLVTDDGVGLSQERMRSGAHIGITGMKERANLVKGELSIESEPGRGTEVSVAVPL